MTPETSDIATVHNGAEACVTLKVGVQPECVLKKVQSVLGECFIVSAGGAAQNTGDVTVQPGPVHISGSCIDPEQHWTSDLLEPGSPYDAGASGVALSTLDNPAGTPPQNADAAFAVDFTGLKNDPGTLLLINQDPDNLTGRSWGIWAGFDRDRNLVVHVGSLGQTENMDFTDKTSSYKFDGSTLTGDGNLVIRIANLHYGYDSGIANPVRVSWQCAEISLLETKKPTTKPYSPVQSNAKLYYLTDLTGATDLAEIKPADYPLTPVVYETASQLRFYRHKSLPWKVEPAAGA